jgi:hypothetical protein
MARRKDGRPRSIAFGNEQSNRYLPAIPRNEEVAKLFPSHELSKPREEDADDER